MNVKDYTSIFRRTSRTSWLYLTTVFLAAVPEDAAAQTPDAILEGRFETDVVLDETTLETFGPVAATHDGSQVGWVWSLADGGAVDLRFTLFDVDAFERDAPSLSDIVTINQEIPLQDGILAYVAQDPSIAPFANGNYLAVWADNRIDENFFDAHATLVSPWGERLLENDIEVNGPSRTDETTVETPSAAALDTLAAIAWIDDRHFLKDVYLRRFRDDGAALDANDIRINVVHQETDAQTPSVAYAGLGSAAAIWTDDRVLVEDPSDASLHPRFDLFARVIPVGSVFDPPVEGQLESVVPSSIPEIPITWDREDYHHALSPRIAAGPGETFVAVWYEETGDGGDIFLSYFTAAGEFYDTRLRVDQALDDEARSLNPDIARLANDFLVVTWEDSAHGGSLFGRVWDPYTGEFVSGEYRIDAPLEDSAANTTSHDPRVTGGRAGDILTGWSSHRAGGRRALFTLDRFFLEGDLNNDGSIAGNDLLHYAFAWSPIEPVVSRADLNGDGYVNRLDLRRQHELVVVRGGVAPQKGDWQEAFARRKAAFKSADRPIPRATMAAPLPSKKIRIRLPREDSATTNKAIRRHGIDRKAEDSRSLRTAKARTTHRMKTVPRVQTEYVRRIWNNGRLIDVQDNGSHNGE